MYRRVMLEPRRQFVLGPRRALEQAGWKHELLPNGFCLSFSRSLPIERMETRDGKIAWLLGLAISPGRSSAADHLKQTNFDELEQATAFWAGRWVLVSATKCLSDAATGLGIFYRHVDGQVWISSSPVILGAMLPGIAEAERIDWRLAHERGMDWIPNPFSSRRGVYKLLPQRWINPETGEIECLSPLPQEGPTLAAYLIGAMQRWGELPHVEKRISLTGGLDTRTVLAAALRSGVKSAICTTGETPYLSWADRHLPPILAKTAGLEHRLLRTPPASEGMEERRSAVELLTDGQLFHPLFERHVSGGNGRDDDAGLTAAEGHIFELGRCYYWRKLGGDARPSPQDLIAKFFKQKPEPYEDWVEALGKWLNSLDDATPISMDWRDRFYLDQRLGSWFSYVQRGQDLRGVASFYPVNSLWAMSRMLEPAVEDRMSGRAQLALIVAMAPQLARYAINPKGPA